MMSEDTRPIILPLTVLVGVASVAWLVSAFAGDVEEMFADRDARFWIVGTMFAAVLVSLASRRVAAAVAGISIFLVLSQTFGGTDVDVGTLRVAAGLQALFVAGLWFDLREERQVSTEMKV